MAMMRESENKKQDYMANKIYLKKSIEVDKWGKLNGKWSLGKKSESEFF
jgi:hypothetical protein